MRRIATFLLVTALFGGVLSGSGSAVPGADVDVTAHGAKANDTVDDSAAIQAANNAVSQAGGGRVRFPAGTFLARKIKQDSGVDFVGAGRDATTIKFYVPSGTTPIQTPMIEGRQWTKDGTTTLLGTIAKGSTTMTVSDPTLFRPGSMVAVKAAGGPAPDQATTLSFPILAGATSLRVNSTEDFASISDSRYLLIEGEIVSYKAASMGSISGVVRGRYRTTARAHPNGAPVAQLRRLVAQVTAVSGNTVTLDAPARFSVTSVPVTVGSMDMTVRDLTLDGSQRTPGSWPVNPWPLYYALGSDITVTETKIQNGDDGGLALDIGTRDSVVQGNIFEDNGDEVVHGSGHVWLYRGASHNLVADNAMSGPMKNGIFLDDRTQNATEYDGPSNANVITRNVIDMYEDPSVGSEPEPPTAIGIFGSEASEPGMNNLVTDNDLSFGDGSDPSLRGGEGVVVGWWSQGSDPWNSTGTHVTFNRLSGFTLGLRTNGTGGVFADNVISDNGRACEEFGTGRDNIFAGNIVTPTGECAPRG